MSDIALCCGPPVLGCGTLNVMSLDFFCPLCKWVKCSSRAQGVNLKRTTFHLVAPSSSRHHNLVLIWS